MSDTTTIKVDVRTRDRLNMLAAERGTTVKELVDDFADETLTRQELAARAKAAAAYIRKHLAHDLSQKDISAGARFWEELEAGNVPDSIG
jgi:hypothetical protein